MNAPDVTYFRLPFVGLITYGRGWILPLSGALLVLAALVLVLALGRAARAVGILVGLGLAVLSVTLSAGAGLALIRWLPRFHPEMGALHGSAFHNEGWYVVGLVAVAVAVTTGLFNLARLRYSGSELAFGALLVPLAGAVALSFVMPLAAMNLQWPVAAALISVVFLDLPRGRVAFLAWVATLLLATVILALVAPLLELVWLALSLSAGLYIGALTGVAMLLLLPALDRLREPNGWWAPAVGVGLAVAFVGVGIALATPSAGRPQPTTLLYALDREGEEAIWITSAREGPLEERALAWAETRTGSSFQGSDGAELFGYGRPSLVASAPVSDVAPLDVVVVSDSGVLEGDPAGASGGPSDTTLVVPAAGEPAGTDSLSVARLVRVAVRSGSGAELVVFRFDVEGGPRLVGVNGRVLSGERPVSRLEHWGAPVDAILLDLEIPTGGELAFEAVEHHLRPEELVGTVPFIREPHLAPNIRDLSDRALIRTVVGGDVPPPVDSVGAVLRDSMFVTPPPADSVVPDTAEAQPDTIVVEPDTAAAARSQTDPIERKPS